MVDRPASDEISEIDRCSPVSGYAISQREGPSKLSTRCVVYWEPVHSLRYSYYIYFIRSILPSSTYYRHIRRSVDDFGENLLNVLQTNESVHLHWLDNFQR